MSESSCDRRPNLVSTELSSALMGNASTSEVGEEIVSEENVQVSPTEVPFMLWHANIDDVESVEEDDPLILSLLPDEKVKVKRFKFADDQKRALLSILLQRALIRSVFNTLDNFYELRRSREGKPYVVSRDARLDFKTWNFNVSHHGKYVCIVAHATLLVGVDIVDLTTRSNMSKQGSAMEFVEIFEPQLTVKELTAIRSQRSEEARFSMFYVLWSLKEAYIKAIGQGLGYDLQQVEFEVAFEPGFGLNDCEDGMLKGGASVRVDGVLREDWRMDFVSLDSIHVMTVSRGPLLEALPTYRAQAGWDSTLSTQGSVNNMSNRILGPLVVSQYKSLGELHPPKCP